MIPDVAHTIFCRAALLPQGWCAGVRLKIASGRITAVELNAVAAPDDDICEAAVPGLANLHSHAFQRAMAGLAEHRGPGTDSFWTWREAMYRFLDRLSPDDVTEIAAQAYVEMLESGFTRVGEFHYLHHGPTGAPYAQPAEMADRIVEAAAQTGIGLTLLPCFYAHSGFGNAPPKPGQLRFIHDPDSFARLFEASLACVTRLPDANIGLAPHSLRAVSASDLATVVALCPAGPIHIHAAEQAGEVKDCVAATGQRPVRWLLDHAGVDARWCLIHATHMEEQEARDLAASGAVAGLCPITEANLGDGIFRASTYRRARGRFGVGSDSNVAIGAAAELRQLEYGQRLRRQARNVLADGPGRSTARALFDTASAGGAQALGQEPAGLAPGAAADIVGLDQQHLALVGRAGDALLDGWVFASQSPPIDTVWRAGARVVRDGRHVDAPRIAARYAACLRRLLAP